MNEAYVFKSLEQQLKEFKILFLNAPKEQIENALKDKIRDWKSIPQAIEILQVLDYAIMYSLASEFSVSILQITFKVALENEQKTIQDLLHKAWWRD